MYLITLGFKMAQNGESDIGLSVWFGLTLPLFFVSTMALAARVKAIQKIK